MKQLKLKIDSLRHSIPFESVFVVLVLISVGSLAVEFFYDLDESTSLMLARVDIAIAWVFLIDFFVGLFVATNNKKYFKSDWYLLLGSIPVHEYIFSSLRIVRILRVFRLYSVGTRAAIMPGIRKSRK